MPQVVGGRYQLIAQLGGGGMADVYLATPAAKTDFAKLTVLKRLKVTEDDDQEILGMFADEARLSARLNHPNIVQTFEVGEDDGGPFLVMEYIEGQPLGRIRSRAVRRGKPLERAMSLKIIREVVGALAYAHDLTDHDGSRLNLVHRDVSPENIMVTYAGVTKLVDFGVAKTASSMSRTRAGVLKGKIAYMAPEQARSDESIDGRADIFSVGLVLWELLTGRRLWDGMTEAKVFERLLDREPLPRPRSVDETVPAELDEICAKAIAKDRERRFASAHELLDALDAASAKSNLRAEGREVGQFVSTLFEAEREKVRGLVAGAMARKDESSGPILSNEESDPMLWRTSVPELQSAPMLGSSPGTPSERKERSLPANTGIGVADIDVTEASLKRTNPAKVAVGVVGAAAVIAGAVFVGKGLGASEADAVPTPPPVVVVAAPPPPSASAEVPDVQIDVWVKPTGARLSVDGAPVSGNPFHLATRKNPTIHELKVEADGYEPRTLSVAFDRDRAIDLQLSPKPTATVARAPAPPPPPVSAPSSEPAPP